MRIAAIDCGSNSFHLLIADALGHDQIRAVEDDKTMLYLGAEVAQTSKISDASLLRAKRVIRHYKTLIKRHNVDIVRCVATSAIRSAENGDSVIDSLSKTLGYKVEVISGEEEARIIFRAISAVSALPETRILAIDMGGGSLELMAGQRYGLENAISVGLGASRVAKELNVNDPLTKDDIKNIENKCNELFKDFSSNYPAELFSNVVASSGTLTSIITMARAKIDEYVSLPLTVIHAKQKEIESICDDLISLNPKARRKLLGYDKARDDFLPTAAVIAKTICSKLSGNAPWMISPYALREGIVLTISDSYHEEEQNIKQIASRTIDELEQKMNLFDRDQDSSLIRHCQKVSSFSEIIFNTLQPIHKFKDNELTLLKYASRIHDIGETINHSKHDQHGAYILSSIALVGFSVSDSQILKGVIRWHRTRDPKTNDKYVGKMDDDSLHKAKWLTAIIRIADGLDSGKSQIIDDLKITINPDVIFIRVHSEHDCELEMYSARRKRHLLEEISGRDVVIEKALSSQVPQSVQD